MQRYLMGRIINKIKRESRFVTPFLSFQKNFYLCLFFPYPIYFLPTQLYFLPNQ